MEVSHISPISRIKYWEFKILLQREAHLRNATCCLDDTKRSIVDQGSFLNKEYKKLLVS